MAWVSFRGKIRREARICITMSKTRIVGLHFYWSGFS